MKRKSYSPKLLPDSFYSENFELSFRKIQTIQELYLSHKISAVEFVSLLLFYFNWTSHKNKAVGGPRKPLTCLQNSYATSLATACHLLEIPNRWPEYSHCSFFQFYIEKSHRQIPEAALISLENWAQKRYPLQLLFYTPSVKEVLEMQASGVRCISVLCDRQDLLKTDHAGRDVFSFILHDLIHADHFFHHQELANAQIAFANKMLMLIDHPFIVSALQNDPIFQTEFDYLVSDMNTVPLHLIKSLKAIILRYFKRTHHIEQKNHLPAPIETQFQDQFNQILTLWHFSPAVFAIAKKLNTPDFQPQTDGAILTKELIF